MNTLLDPSILFISEEHWQNDDLRDEFLQHLLDNLMYIDEYKITKIYWSEEIEELLWLSPQVPPWRQDKDWKMQLVPIIYNKLNSNREFLIFSNSSSTATCTITPELNTDSVKDEVKNVLIKLINELIYIQQDIFFCVGKNNQLPPDYNYIFCSQQPAASLEPELINSPNEWLRYINTQEDFWPIDSSDEQVDRFITAIKLTLELRFKGNQVLYKFQLEKEFIRDILSERRLRFRKRILEHIAKRLILTTQKASKDISLQDEFIDQSKQYRFRVTPRPSSARIHYVFLGEGTINFLRYYRDGAHDDGL